MLAQDLRPGIGGHRGPPQLGLQAAGVDGVGDAPHVAVAAGEAFVGLPVAFGDLESVVDIDPFEAQLRHLGQRADHLVGREGPLIAPGAPHGLESSGSEAANSTPLSRCIYSENRWSGL